VFEGVALGTRAKDAALDEDELREREDGEGDVDEDVGSACIALGEVLVTVAGLARRGVI
jgi:hypothetical protein